MEWGLVEGVCLWACVRVCVSVCVGREVSHQSLDIEDFDGLGEEFVWGVHGNSARYYYQDRQWWK